MANRPARGRQPWWRRSAVASRRGAISRASTSACRRRGSLARAWDRRRAARCPRALPATIGRWCCCGCPSRGSSLRAGARPPRRTGAGYPAFGGAKISRITYRFGFYLTAHGYKSGSTPKPLTSRCGLRDRVNCHRNQPNGVRGGRGFRRRRYRLRGSSVGRIDLHQLRSQSHRTDCGNRRGDASVVCGMTVAAPAVVKSQSPCQVADAIDWRDVGNRD